MPRSNVFIYIFTAIEIGFTQSQQLVGLLHFWMTLVLLAYSLVGGGGCLEGITFAKYKDSKVFIVK